MHGKLRKNIIFHKQETLWSHYTIITLSIELAQRVNQGENEGYFLTEAVIIFILGDQP